MSVGLGTVSRDLAHLLSTLDDWLPALRTSLAQVALNQGDLRILTKMVRHLQETAPDLVLLEVGSGQIILYLNSLTDSSRITMMFADGLSPKAISRSGAACQHVEQWHALLHAVWTGHVAWCYAQQPGAITINLAKPPHRNIAEPHTELSVRGPQEAFVEPNDVKLAQIRQRLPSVHLAVELTSVGTRFPVSCHLIYIDGIASKTVVETVRYRIKAITVDSVANATRLGSFIRDHPWSVFPTVRYIVR